MNLRLLGGEGVEDFRDAGSTYEKNVTEMNTSCMDIHHSNGTVYFKPCPIDWREKIGKCDSIFKSLHFWGANIVIFANLIYIFPYFIVVVFYFVIPDLRHRAYDRAVLSYNAGQFIIAFVLLGMGHFVLCHKPIRPVWIYIVLGLTLQFSTVSSVFWLNVICFDMTLVITRFRWIPGSDVSGSEENRKYRMYCLYAWGGGLVITAITCFIELCPWIPTSSPIKPNFERFDDGANYAVIFHVSTVPVITLILNNVLFAYTTYKVVKIRRSTATVNENNKKVNRKYFMFLRLYLLMDAPWIIGVMAAIYPEIWALKFCRMLQPILMLLAILPKKTLYRAMKCGSATNNRVENRNKNAETLI